ncbi:MAG: hypothetical protein ACOH2A_03710 [Sphingobacteriaceae bacterium]
MKNRILTGWTFRRVLYVAIGLFVVIQSVMQQQWLGIFLGSYFASMGIFAFGCAAGNCAAGNCNTDQVQNKKAENQYIN